MKEQPQVKVRLECRFLIQQCVKAFRFFLLFLEQVPFVFQRFLLFRIKQARRFRFFLGRHGRIVRGLARGTATDLFEQFHELRR